jgi:hypothetical protein
MGDSLDRIHLSSGMLLALKLSSRHGFAFKPSSRHCFFEELVI